MKRAALFAVSVLSCGQSARPVVVGSHAETVVHGHVFDEAGKPLPLAHVAVDGGVRREVARDGSFSISWPPNAKRLTELVVTGVAHRTESLIIASEDHELDVTIKLGAPAPQGEIEPGIVVYTTPDAKPRRMTRDWDGTTFSATVEAADGRYAYEILGVLNEGVSAGVEPIDGYELTPSGLIYRPQIVVRGGSARITVDPRKMHASFTTIDFAPPTSVSAALTAIELRIAQANQRFSMLLDGLMHAKGGPSPELGERADAAEQAEWTAMRKDLAARAKSGTPELVRHRAALGYFRGTPIKSPTADERAMANRLLTELTPDDALWALHGSLDNVLSAADATPEHRDYATAFIAKQPDAFAVGEFLLARLEVAKDPAEIRALFDELKKPRYAELPMRDAMSMYDPDRRLAPGKAVQFDVKSLSSPGQLTPKDFTGIVYLIDVWGTWCAPCIAEVPHLHELYAKFGGPPTDGRRKRFEIVSIAAEHDADLIAKFRADKAHPMPWKNAIADPDTFLESFGGFGFPTYVLVDESGKVIKSSPQLRRDELPELLDRVLR